jgi:hypothetical protein
MQQLDLFEETLEKKIYRMEKWVGRLQKEIWFLKEVYNLSKKHGKIDTSSKHVQQIDIFSVNL